MHESAAYCGEGVSHFVFISAQFLFHHVLLATPACPTATFTRHRRNNPVHVPKCYCFFTGQANHMQQFMHYSSIQSWELAVSPSMTDTVATTVARDTGQLSQVRPTTYPYVPMHAQKDFQKDFQLWTLTLKKLYNSSRLLGKNEFFMQKNQSLIGLR